MNDRLEQLLLALSSFNVKVLDRSYEKIESKVTLRGVYFEGFEPLNV